MGKKMISVEISDDLREALRIRAFKENVSTSKLIRNLLETQLNDELNDIKQKTGD